MRLCCLLAAPMIVLAVSGPVLGQYGDISDLKVAKPEDKVDAAAQPRQGARIESVASRGSPRASGKST